MYTTLEKICSVGIGFVQLGFIFFCMLDPCDAVVYEVGPTKPFNTISTLPLDSLNPGDVIKIHYKESPYYEKIILRRAGTRELPIVFEGILEKGKRPIIDGNRAVQKQKDNLSQSGRWLIKVGDETSGDYIKIKNLELRGANNLNNYSYGCHQYYYQDNAAGVFVKAGKNVLISGCLIHGCGNGVQTSYGPNVSGVVISNCIIYDNGNHRNIKSSQEHNGYLCGTNSIVQFCRFGEAHSDGNNIKDRGKNTIIRYNWIEGGKNRQIDLVEHTEYGRSDAYVYGNVIVQGHKIHNFNMINWGGEKGSRSGILYLFNNTIVGKSHLTQYIVSRYPDCHTVMINNAFLGAGILWKGVGHVAGSHNWFSKWINLPGYGNLGLKGSSPGVFLNGRMKYMPIQGSPLVNNGTNATPIAVTCMPKQYSSGYKRPNRGPLDIGAFEAIQKRK